MMDSRDDKFYTVGAVGVTIICAIATWASYLVEDTGGLILFSALGGFIFADVIWAVRKWAERRGRRR